MERAGLITAGARILSRTHPNGESTPATPRQARAERGFSAQQDAKIAGLEARVAKLESLLARLTKGGAR